MPHFASNSFVRKLLRLFENEYCVGKLICFSMVHVTCELNSELLNILIVGMALVFTVQQQS